MIILRKIF